MPLKEGASQKTISANIEHCMSKFHDTGKVSGTSVSADKARQMCAAMAYGSARKSAHGSSLVKHLKKG